VLERRVWVETKQPAVSCSWGDFMDEVSPELPPLFPILAKEREEEEYDDEAIARQWLVSKLSGWDFRGCLTERKFFLDAPVEPKALFGASVTAMHQR
ncbi:hypothetical protein M9458_010650, partial [Cirrhinus mrigala]